MRLKWSETSENEISQVESLFVLIALQQGQMSKSKDKGRRNCAGLAKCFWRDECRQTSHEKSFITPHYATVQCTHFITRSPRKITNAKLHKGLGDLDYLNLKQISCTSTLIPRRLKSSLNHISRSLYSLLILINHVE